MNRGLFEKSLREIWPPTLGFGLLLLLVKTALAFILPTLQTGLYALMLKMKYSHVFLSALLGAPVTESNGAQLFQALPWVHPLVLLIVFAHVVTICTRMPAAEIDRGTIDTILGLPVSRWQVYIHHSLVWAASGVTLLLMGLAGNALGAHLSRSAMLPAGRITICIFNAFCLYFAIGGFTCLVACCCDRRGRATGVVIPVIVTSFLINFLASLWPPAKHIDWLSVLTYYRPFTIFQSGLWPLKDMITLLITGLACWTIGGVVFKSRDIHTL